ncbi:hypothetical protein ACFWUQ_04245, partial [Streptomyces sp. NPDC058662]
QSVARARAAQHLDRVGLGDTGGNYPSQRAGGQQQRGATARAMPEGRYGSPYRPSGVRRSGPGGGGRVSKSLPES